MSNMHSMQPKEIGTGKSRGLERQGGFTKALSVGVALLFLFLIALFLNLFNATVADHEAYVSLMVDANQSSHNRSSKTAYTAAQIRHDVRKDLFFLEGEVYHELRLICSSSVMRLHRGSDGKSQLIEDMGGVECLMQEELYYVDSNGKRSATPCELAVPMQVIRRCTADCAQYSYQTELCIAQEVEIFRYLCHGHSLNEVKIESLIPVMTGKSASIEFSLAGSELNFKAKQLKGTWSVGGAS